MPAGPTPAEAPAPRPRLAASGRPHQDPACAGCAQLPLLRALRRSGLGLEGGLGCDPGAPPPAPEPAAGRWALVAAAREARARPAALAAAARGRALLVVADRGGPARGDRIADGLRAAGTPARALDPRAPGDVAAALAWAEVAGPGAALVALAPCARAAPRRPPLRVEARRCSRCGACLQLGCPALSDDGGEAIRLDAALCSGCDACGPLCRGRALVR